MAIGRLAVKFRSTWKAFARWLVIIVAAGVWSGGVAVVTRDVAITASAPSIPAPTLEELNVAIGLAEDYLGGLYKPLGEEMAVQSEYYALPIRAYFPASDNWMALGADGTIIEPVEDSRSDEHYRLSFSDAIVVSIAIRWDAEQYLGISLQPERVKEAVEIWIGDKKLVTLRPDTPVLMTGLQIERADRSVLQSLRYTVRHATQEAYMYWTAKGDQEKAGRLKHFLETNQYTPGFDMRAIIFNRAKNLPDDLPFNKKAYEDCVHLPQGDDDAYPYESKACAILTAYVNAGERDPFLQASQALHTLQKYAPDHPYSHWFGEQWWIQGSTPLETATHLRKQWARTDVGIPSCTPFSCTSTASSIRTFMYGTLELELGVRLGDQTAMQYADAAARSAVSVQIKKDGVIQMLSGPAYRPAHTGSFPAYWDKEYRFVPPKPSLAAGAALVAMGETPMPPEYMGILPSNSESTFDGWAFLSRYRCAKYGAGCVL